MSRLPGVQHNSKKLMVELKIIWHSDCGDKVIVTHMGQHHKTWAYSFKQMDIVGNIGPHTLILQAVLRDEGATDLGGRPLPCHKIKFTSTEGPSSKFSIDILDPPFRVDVPFNIPLLLQDEFNNPTKPTPNLKPVLEASGLVMSYEKVEIEGNSLIVKEVKASGVVGSAQGKKFNMTVTIPGLEIPTQQLKIRILPGEPHKIIVPTFEGTGDLCIENGKEFPISVEIRDRAGNFSVHQNIEVQCEFHGADGLPSYRADCSNSGKVTLTGNPIFIKNISKKSHEITAKIELPHMKGVSSVEKVITVKPSSSACKIKVFFCKDDPVEIKPQEDIEWTAGQNTSHMRFTLYDEGENQMKITKEQASKFKFTWLRTFDTSTVMEGNLPPIKVPKSVGDIKFCQLRLTDGSGLEFSFNIKPIPGEAKHIKCQSKKSVKVKLGEILDGDIVVHVIDEHGNIIKKLPHDSLSNLSVKAEDLDTKVLQKTLLPNVGFSLGDIKFDGSIVGDRPVLVKYNDFTDLISLEVLPGQPAQLLVMGWMPEETLIAYDGAMINNPLGFQVCDKSGNPISDVTTPISLQYDKALKVLSTASLTAMPFEGGQVTFGKLTISGPYGKYMLHAKMSMERSSLMSSGLAVQLKPDPNKARTRSVYIAGDHFPVGAERRVRYLTTRASVELTKSPYNTAIYSLRELLNAWCVRNRALNAYAPKAYYALYVFCKIATCEPHKIIVPTFEETDNLFIENGKALPISVEIRDRAGNFSVHPKLVVQCKFHGADGLPSYKAECSNSGKATLTGSPIFIKNISKKSQKITARIELPHMPGVSSVEKAITVKPSTSACKIKVFFCQHQYLDYPKKKPVEVKPKGDIEWTAGEDTSQISFALFDEGNNHMKITKELANKFKFNWLPSFNPSTLMEGYLPPIKVPNTVGDSKFCQLRITDGSGLEFSFNIKPIPGEATQIKCQNKTSTKVKLGETLDGDIVVHVTDAYCNSTKKLPHDSLSNLIVKAEDLDTKVLQKVLLPNVGFGLRNIKFDAVGVRVVVVKYNDFTDHITLEVLPGRPAKLLVMGWMQNETLIAYDGVQISNPLGFQVCDESGNDIFDVDKTISLQYDKTLKVSSTVPLTARPDSDGRVTFGKLTLSGPCGKYMLHAKMSMERSSLSSSGLAVQLKPDPKKAQKLQLDYREGDVYIARDLFPDAKKQQQMSRLSKERDTLTASIRRYKKMFEGKRQLLQICKESAEDAAKNELELREELRIYGVRDAQIATRKGSEELMISTQKSIEQLRNKPRRKCGMPRYETRDGEILGKVAHLVEVEEENDAFVLSWHMASDMNCVLTTTVTKAKEVFANTRGLQQVLPIESIYTNGLTEWDK
ncbi:structural maintenance of chromosomes flexible hinge domain-containing protein 1-like [Strongylocentrotus purpuratus]|uniref:Structural maintenance of chromosomes flexible hinge domain-containing protein 1 n=1 Tax=Strongylocentrotus purpuratus TaxID=7668 RepID=A0A7M7P349_STRPU|nr:structural maintenance of chromosomes flexible hinge domain-containing protein 1-like [Strongylocentrotus purpuratus]